MEHRMKMVLVVLLSCVLLGILLYFLYKRYYEKKINQVLEGKRVRALEPGTLMKIYVLCSAAALIITAIMTPTNRPAEECSLVNRIAFTVLGEEEKRGMYEGMLPEKLGDTYSLQIEEVEENLTVYYATNGKNYGYILEYKLTHEPQEKEVFHISVSGATSDIGAQYAQDGKLSIFLDGTLEDRCEAMTFHVSISNFCEGENLYPIHIQKDIQVASGGVTS